MQKNWSQFLIHFQRMRFHYVCKKLCCYLSVRYAITVVKLLSVLNWGCETAFGKAGCRLHRWPHLKTPTQSPQKLRHSLMISCHCSVYMNSLVPTLCYFGVLKTSLSFFFYSFQRFYCHLSLEFIRAAPNELSFFLINIESSQLCLSPPIILVLIE